jgi:hypothetical protein
MDSQASADVLMIRPVRFAGNPQTQASNRFQAREAAIEETQAQALVEFEALSDALRSAGVATHIIDDTHEPHTPDSIFPNNWVSFHADGTVVLYPMLAANRRLERRDDVLAALSAKRGFRITRVIDLSPHERGGKYLEGTGSLVLDRVHRVAYACVSPRTDIDVLGDFAQQLDYDVVAFAAHDAEGAAIYHTNVLMCVGERFAAVCLESIREQERAGVLDALRTTGHAVLDLTLEQMGEFAGNMLELKNASGEAIVAMSSRAHAALTPAQCALLREHSGAVVASSIPTIETLGGGSVRCMLAEIHLPRKER